MCLIFQHTITMYIIYNVHVCSTFKKMIFSARTHNVHIHVWRKMSQSTRTGTSVQLNVSMFAAG